MTQDDVIRLATEAGLCSVSNGFVDWIDAGPSLYEMTLFAKLVAEHSANVERERIKQANKPELEKCNAYIKELEKAVIDEREACAKACEYESGDGPDNGCCPTYWNEAQEACAAAIRARGETTSRGQA
jgi:hypothetical protein